MVISCQSEELIYQSWTDNRWIRSKKKNPVEEYEHAVSRKMIGTCLLHVQRIYDFSHSIQIWVKEITIPETGIVFADYHITRTIHKSLLAFIERARQDSSEMMASNEMVLWTYPTLWNDILLLAGVYVSRQRNKAIINYERITTIIAVETDIFVETKYVSWHAITKLGKIYKWIEQYLKND